MKNHQSLKFKIGDLVRLKKKLTNQEHNLLYGDFLSWLDPNDFYYINNTFVKSYKPVLVLSVLTLKKSYYLELLIGNLKEIFPVEVLIKVKQNDG